MTEGAGVMRLCSGLGGNVGKGSSVGEGTTRLWCSVCRYTRSECCALRLLCCAPQGSCRNPHPQLLLRCEHWLEVTDEQHRYGSNLRCGQGTGSQDCCVA